MDGLKPDFDKIHCRAVLPLTEGGARGEERKLSPELELRGPGVH